MTSKTTVDDFIAQPVLAVAGASRDSRKFGNAIYRELKTKGYRVFAVNPNAETVEGDPSYKTLADLPEKVGGVVIVTPPTVTEKLVQDAAAAGICRVWMQQGSQSPAAIKFCQDHDLNLVHGECILMYQSNPASFHKFHKFVKELFGGKPK
jgi:predicted CoA-binding protein